MKLLQISSEWDEIAAEKDSAASAGTGAAQESALDFLKSCYKGSTAQLQSEIQKTQSEIGNMLRFLEEAFGKGLELSLAVNDLSAVPEAAYFIGRFVSEEYFAQSREFLLHKQEDQLLQEINLTM